MLRKERRLPFNATQTGKVLTVGLK